MKKECTKCGILKSISEYHKCKKGKFGVKSICKKCRVTECRDRYVMDKRRIIDTALKWRYNNFEKWAEYSKQYQAQWLSNNPTYKADYMKRYNTKYITENRHKIDCHKKVHEALKQGKILKKKCAVCNSSSTEAHHEDYNKPLDVVWLCRKHHSRTHSKRSI